MDKTIGAQSFTIRDFCQTEKGLDESLKKVAKAGYKTIQISGIGDIKPKKVRELCDKYGITPLLTHRPFDEYVNKLDNVIKYHADLGVKDCGLGWLPNDKDDLNVGKDYIKQLIPQVKKLKEAGLNFGYHNHCFEFQKFGEETLMDFLISETDFDFIVDVYWVAFSGIDPARFIKKLGKRAKFIHFKDLAISGMSIEMAEVGKGNLNFDEIISACDEAGSLCAFVEQDICKADPFESLKISYDYLAKKGFN